MADDDEGKVISMEEHKSRIPLAERAKKKKEKKGSEVPPNEDGLAGPLTNDRGELVKNVENVKNALHWMGFWFGYNRMLQSVFCSYKGAVPAVELRDVDIPIFAAEIAKAFAGTHVGKDLLFDAVDLAADGSTFHPFADWFNGVKWDGVERIKDIPNTVLGVSPGQNEYAAKVMRMTMVAIVRRNKAEGSYGVKFDTMPVLVGEQGVGKSTFWKELLPSEHWFSDHFSPEWDGKQVIENTRGMVVVEWAELTYKKRADTDKIKSSLSRTTDVGRTVWKRLSKSVPRQFVLVGTTNNEEFLNDMTGNRRYLPIDCRGVETSEGKMFVNIPWLRQHREQLWAEAVHYDNKGEQIYFTKDDEALAEGVRETHTETDPWWDKLAPLLPEEGIWSVMDALERLGMDQAGQLTNYHFGRLGGLARSNGWTKRRIATKDGVKETFFFRGKKYSGMWDSSWRHKFSM